MPLAEVTPSFVVGARGGVQEAKYPKERVKILFTRGVDGDTVFCIMCAKTAAIESVDTAFYLARIRDLSQNKYKKHRVFWIFSMTTTIWAGPSTEAVGEANTRR